MGIFQEMASRPENIAKRTTRRQAMRAELKMREFDTIENLVSGYAQAHNISETEAQKLVRVNWNTTDHFSGILSNPKSAYSGYWGKVSRA